MGFHLQASGRQPQVSITTRLWEKLTGKPHEHQNARMVHDATSRLLETNAYFFALIKPYSEAEDPLAMLLQDALNQRARGNDGTTELHT